MFLRTEIISPKSIVGNKNPMSFASDTTRELFQSFMPRRMTIPKRMSIETLCVQNYPEGFFRNFNPAATFEKWAAVEVSDFDSAPEGMETMIIPEGLYAVFLFKGRTSEAGSFFSNIFMNWFPASQHELDVRPHFEILGAKYKHDSADSEEEVWIPLKAKIKLKRTDSLDTEFVSLVKLLDAELAIRDGNDHAFYHQFNKIDMIRQAVVAYENEKPVSIGAIKELTSDVMEVKRMFTLPDQRGKGIAVRVLNELEQWAKELGYKKCMLETGKKQREAIALYQKSGYRIIPNYGQYSGIENSVCFEKLV